MSWLHVVALLVSGLLPDTAEPALALVGGYRLGREVGGPAAAAPTMVALGSAPFLVGVIDLGISERTVVLEFDSVEQAIAAHDSPAYQEALRLLGNAVDRDLRIVEGVE